MADRKTTTKNDLGPVEKSATGRGTGAGSRVWEGEGADELFWLGNAAGKALELRPLDARREPGAEGGACVPGSEWEVQAQRS